MIRLTKKWRWVLGALIFTGASLLTLYFLNLLPFARAVNLKTDADVRAYLLRIRECEVVDYVERLNQEQWIVLCDAGTKVIGGRFWVDRGGEITTESELID